MGGIKNISGSRIFTRAFRALLVGGVSLGILLFFPYYPLSAVALVVAGIVALSWKYPTAALAIGLLLSTLAAYYQYSFFGMIYMLLCLFALALARTWPTLTIVLLGWVLAFSPLSLMAFVPVIVCGLVLGPKEAAKAGAALAVSLFFLGWMNGLTSVGLIVVPYSTVAGKPYQAAPSPWLPISFVYGARSPDSTVYGQLQATLLRNFMDDITFYIEVASWIVGGYLTGIVANKWKREHPWIVAAAVGFIPFAAAYSYGASFFVATPGFEIIFGLTGCLVGALFLQVAKLDLVRMTALHKAKMSEVTAIAQPILEKQQAKPELAWEQIGGYQGLKQEIRDSVLMPLQKPDLAKAYGAEPPKGVLLFGPPGCGKTLVAKAAAGSMNTAFLTINGAELAQRAAEDVSGAIKEIFYRARENIPSIIFIDEIESLASARDARTQAGTGAITQLLIEMDGMKELRDVMVLAATNKPQWIDAALLRPGRFDKVVNVPPPDLEARKAIFRISLGNSPATAVDYNVLAGLTEGYSGADIAAIVKDAKMAAVRDTLKGLRHEEITMQDLGDATKRNRPSITKESLEECRKFLETYGERT